MCWLNKQIVRNWFVFTHFTSSFVIRWKKNRRYEVNMNSPQGDICVCTLHTAQHMHNSIGFELENILIKLFSVNASLIFTDPRGDKVQTVCYIKFDTSSSFRSAQLITNVCLTKLFFPVVYLFVVFLFCVFRCRERKRYRSLFIKIKSPPSNKCYRISRRWTLAKRQKRFFRRTFRRICCCWRSKRARSTLNLALSTWKPVKSVTTRCWAMVCSLIFDSIIAWSASQVVDPFI